MEYISKEQGNNCTEEIYDFCIHSKDRPYKKKQQGAANQDEKGADARGNSIIHAPIIDDTYPV
jgi:hypothetical protein